MAGTRMAFRALGRRWPSFKHISHCCSSAIVLIRAAMSGKREWVDVAEEQSLVSGGSGRYAKALYDTAEDQGVIDAVDADLVSLDRMMAESSDLKRLVASPVFSSEDQLKALGAIMAKAGMSPVTRNFLSVVASNRRLFALPAILKDFRTLVANHRGETAAEVTSAQPLTPSQSNELQGVLGSHAGRNVKIVSKIDPSILGGLIVKIGSRMIDSSLRTKLNNLKFAMKEVR